MAKMKEVETAESKALALLPEQFEGAVGADFLSTLTSEGFDFVEPGQSRTMDVGEKVRGIYNGRDDYDFTDRDTGMTKRVAVYLIEKDDAVIERLAGSSQLDRVMRQTKAGEEVVIVRGPDMKHPEKKAWTIAQYRLFHKPAPVRRS